MKDAKKKGRSIAPGQDVKVDFFRPQDADGVAALFLTVYGKAYPIKTFIDPQRLKAENEAGRTLSSVARTPEGDIVGHNALFNSAPCDGIYESGAGVVHPAYRNTTGIFSRLVEHGFIEGPKRYPVETIYGEPVCNHVYSQKLCRRLGWITHAVEVALMPASVYAREKSASGRVSALLDFITLKARPHAVYYPKCYKDQVQFLYAGLDDDRKLIQSDAVPSSSKKTRMDMHFFDFARVARVAVMGCGVDFMDVFQEKEHACRRRGGVVIQVWVDLGAPEGAFAVRRLRERGYFFGGILPRWFNTDGMLMQKIFEPPDWEHIQIHSDRAKTLLELVKGDWEASQKPDSSSS